MIYRKILDSQSEKGKRKTSIEGLFATLRPHATFSDCGMMTFSPVAGGRSQHLATPRREIRLEIIFSSLRHQMELLDVVPPGLARFARDPGAADRMVLLLLSHQDSNLDQENQNLLCCHYTMGQVGVGVGVGVSVEVGFWVWGAKLGIFSVNLYFRCRKRNRL